MEQYNILVVDDDRGIVDSLSKLLECEGYNVLKAYDGMEAVDMMERNQIHLILLDVMMPKLSGLAVLMKIREKKNIPVIMLSAKTEDSDKVLGLSMGPMIMYQSPIIRKSLWQESNLSFEGILHWEHLIKRLVREKKMCWKMGAYS